MPCTARFCRSINLDDHLKWLPIDALSDNGLDGTLIDSAPDVCAALNRAFDGHGLPPLVPEQVRKMVGHGARKMIEQAVEEHGQGKQFDIDALLDQFLLGYSARPVENTVIYPGVLEILGEFKAAGTPVGICTNKPERTAFPVMEALGLNDYFGAIVCGDTLPYSKPDRRHVEKVIDLIGGDAVTAVFVGDSETDVAAARNADLPMVLVSFGYTVSPPEELAADFLIHRFHDLPGILTTLN